MECPPREGNGCLSGCYPRGEGDFCVSLSMSKSQGERAGKREPDIRISEWMWEEEGEIPWEKVGRNTIWYMVSYRTVLVLYRTVYGIVPYGIGPQGGKSACVKRRLASFRYMHKIFTVCF